METMFYANRGVLAAALECFGVVCKLLSDVSFEIDRAKAAKIPATKHA